MTGVAGPVARNRDLDPVAVKYERVIHTASNNRVSWVGKRVAIHLRSGELRRCEHHSGHRSTDALRRCAQSLVDRLNREAGTTSAEVEATKRVMSA